MVTKEDPNVKNSPLLHGSSRKRLVLNGKYTVKYSVEVVAKGKTNSKVETKLARAKSMISLFHDVF